MFNLREMFENAVGMQRKPAPQPQRGFNRQPNGQPIVNGRSVPMGSQEDDFGSQQLRTGQAEDESLVRTQSGMRPLSSVNPGRWWQNPQTGYTPPHLGKRYEDGSGYNQFGQPYQAFDDSQEDYTRKFLGL